MHGRPTSLSGLAALWERPGGVRRDGGLSRGCRAACAAGLGWLHFDGFFGRWLLGGYGYGLDSGLVSHCFFSRCLGSFGFLGGRFFCGDWFGGCFFGRDRCCSCWRGYFLGCWLFGCDLFSHGFFGRRLFSGDLFYGRGSRRRYGRRFFLRGVFFPQATAPRGNPSASRVRPPMTLFFSSNK